MELRGRVWLHCSCGLLCVPQMVRSEEHTSELQSQSNLVCRLLLDKKKESSTIPQLPTPTCQHLVATKHRATWPYDVVNNSLWICSTILAHLSSSFSYIMNI